MQKFIQEDKSGQFEVLLETMDLRKEFPEHFLSSFKTQFEKYFIKQGIKMKAIVLKSKKALPH